MIGAYCSCGHYPVAGQGLRLLVTGLRYRSPELLQISVGLLCSAGVALAVAPCGAFTGVMIWRGVVADTAARYLII